MENMIRRIVDMDKKAREITQAAQREKIESEKNIGKKAERLRHEALSNARRSIRDNMKLENKVLEQEWDKKKAVYDAQLEKMERLYNENGDKWVENIVQSALNDL
ncbi:MAG: hypothetical protein PHH84_07845 [Oscillospiraceae bacterium]|nr:hypothetical protein [Oscillospiraceae bacterium]MDD4413823.1 hypothetical protein [Oscillospiraceae bacterium]